MCGQTLCSSINKVIDSFMVQGGLCHPKQWCLMKKKTITFYTNWHMHMLYNSSLNNKFAPYLKQNEGNSQLQTEVTLAQRKSAVQGK